MIKEKKAVTIFDLDYEVGKVTIGMSELADLKTNLQGTLNNIDESQVELLQENYEKLESIIVGMSQIESRLDDAVENINVHVNELNSNSPPIIGEKMIEKID